MADTSKAPPVEYEDDDLNMPGIRQISNGMAWLEALVTALSGYFLTVAMGIGVVDILTDGQLTTSSPYLTYIYGVSMAAGIGGQLVGLSFRAARCFGRKSMGGFINGMGFLVLVAILSYLEYISANAFSYHKSFGVPTIQTLHDLGWDQRSFIQFRNGVAVGLIILSGFLRYSPKPRKSVAQLQADADRAVAIAAINAQTRGAAIAGFAGMVKGARIVIAQAVTQPPPQGSDNAEDEEGTTEAQEGLSGTLGLTIDSPELKVYVLPSGISLTTQDSKMRMAALLGYDRQQVISEAMKIASMQAAYPVEGQSKHAQNVAVWQVLALIESGLLDLPTHVSKRSLSVVN